MPEQFFLSVLAIAAVLLIVRLSTNRITSRHFNIISQLIKMNEVDGFDPVKLLHHLEPFLTRLGIKDYGYYLFYHNTEYVRRNGSMRKPMEKFVHTADYTVYIGIVPRFGRLDPDFISRILVEIIFLLLKADVNIQTASAREAFRKSEEIQTFVNHDVKNLIQFVNALEFNLNEVQDEAGHKRLTRYLQKSLPSLKVRADKILSALNSTRPEPDSIPEKMRPIVLASDISAIYGIVLHSENSIDTEITAGKRELTVIIENIIKNFYDKSIVEPGIDLFMSIDEEDGAYLLTFRDTGSPIPDCEKIFEPFYSGKVNGLGIGLFHCRNLAMGMNGFLKAENTPDGPVFILSVKK